jgi:cold shock CspA family protein
MDKNAWISKKKEILSKIFISQTADKTSDWGFLTQETPNKKQNKYSVKIDTWTDLLYASSDINPSVESTSFNVHPCGFIVDDETGGDIFVHVENLKKSDLVELNKGDKVSFLQNKKGSRFYASQIKLL